MKKRLISHKKYDRILKCNPNFDMNIGKYYLHTIKNIKECMIFIWLKDGNSFWYYVKHVKNNTLEGYANRKNKWIYIPISINSIEAYY